MKPTDVHVVVIGAGPYGLAAAAHLRAARVETVVFGRVMEFWKNHMPAGMLLRSRWDASHISAPVGLTLNEYYAAAGFEQEKHVSLERFVDYGTWFQRLAVPQVDTRRVVLVEKAVGGFRLLLDDGGAFRSRRVVVAAGIGSFAYRPTTFDHAPPDLVSHSADHRSFRNFAGKAVIVVGAGQSALESATLLHENGAEVELIARAPKIRWLHRREVLNHNRNPFRRLLFHPTDVGPPFLTQISARPEWFQRIPAPWRPGFAYRCIRPAGAAWLKPRLARVTITAGRAIVSVEPSADRLTVNLNDGSKRCVDHVLLATGYRVDISRYPFLGPELVESIRCIDGYPDLSMGFESSIPGLHFLGAPAAWNFGPLMRFVSGTEYSARGLTRFVTFQSSVPSRARSLSLRERDLANDRVTMFNDE
jgi:FAD-dependent urate hydroxylase